MISRTVDTQHLELPHPGQRIAQRHELLRRGARGTGGRTGRKGLKGGLLSSAAQSKGGRRGKGCGVGGHEGMGTRMTMPSRCGTLLCWSDSDRSSRSGARSAVVSTWLEFSPSSRSCSSPVDQRGRMWASKLLDDQEPK